MREDIKLKRYKKIRNDVNDLYCNKYMNVTSACKKIGISPSVYYKACKELGKSSVNTDTYISSKMKEKNSQKGGSKSEKKNQTTKKSTTISKSKNLNNDTSTTNIDSTTSTFDGNDLKTNTIRRTKTNIMQ